MIFGISIKSKSPNVNKDICVCPTLLSNFENWQKIKMITDIEIIKYTESTTLDFEIVLIAWKE